MSGGWPLTPRKFSGDVEMLWRDTLTALQAFRLLTRVSQQTNIKLVDVGRWFVDEDELKVKDQFRSR